MQRHLEFRTVYGLGGIREIRAEWNAVVASMSQPRHLHQFAWFDAYARHLADRPTALRVVVAYRRGSPIGVFPLARCTRTIAGVSARALEIPHHTHLHLGDFVFERQPENSGLVVALLDYLRDEPDGWDVVVAPSALEDSAVLFSVSARQPRFLYLEEASESHYLDNMPYETRLRNLSKSFRNGLRKSRALLAEEKEVEFVRAADPRALSIALDEFVGVEASGWKGQSGTAIRSDPRLMAFYRALVDGFTQTESVQINLLRVGGECIAGQFCLKVDRSLYNLKIGYREDYARLSPGNMLLEHVLKRELEGGHVDVMNLIADSSWQHHWRPRVHKLFTAYAFNHTLRGGIGLRMLHAKDRLRPAYHRYIKPLFARPATLAASVAEP